MTRIPENPTTGDLIATAGQTVGPFFHYGTEYDRMNEIVHPYSPGAILLSGVVYDGSGAPIPDALIEIWQADSDGSIPTSGGSRIRDGHTFSGFGRAATSSAGVYQFWTRLPGSQDGKAPFFSTVVFARGLLDRLHTRIYLPDDAAALAADPFLTSLTEDERATLVAKRTPEGNLEHDIRLQGDRETVFLAF